MWRNYARGVLYKVRQYSIQMKRGVSFDKDIDNDRVKEKEEIDKNVILAEGRK